MLPSPTSNSPKPKVVRTSKLPRYSPLQGHRDFQRTATPPRSSARSYRTSSTRTGSSRKEEKTNDSQPRPPPPPSPAAQNRDNGAAFHYRLKKQAPTSFKQDDVTELMRATTQQNGTENTENREAFRPWISEYRSSYPNSDHKNPPVPPGDEPAKEDRGNQPPKKSRFFAFARSSYKGDGRTFEGKLRDAVNTSKQVRHFKAYNGMDRGEYVPDSEAVTPPVQTPSTQNNVEDTTPADTSDNKRRESENSASQVVKNMREISSDDFSNMGPAVEASAASSSPATTPSSSTPLQSNAAVVSSAASTYSIPTTGRSCNLHPVPKPERPPQPNTTAAVEELGTPKETADMNEAENNSSTEKPGTKCEKFIHSADIGDRAQSPRQQIRPRESLTFNGQFPPEASKVPAGETSSQVPRAFEDHVSLLLSPQNAETEMSKTAPKAIGRSGVAKSKGDQIYDILHYYNGDTNGHSNKEEQQADETLLEADSLEESPRQVHSRERTPRRFPVDGHYTQHLKVNTPEVRATAEELPDKERAAKLGAFGRTYYELYPAPRPVGLTKPADAVRGWNRAVVDQTNPVHLHPRYPPDPNLLKPVETEYQRRCKEVWGKYMSKHSPRK
eukprot:gb/GECG01005930.1/.p1 GENE.gb/GECG01005930.1/~~gb/GECG01005930.1/.p1  ORF type:complete len:614 (+),score=85.72 gb/GECG01005930.1/:1-1842(+)